MLNLDRGNDCGRNKEEVVVQVGNLILLGIVKSKEFTLEYLAWVYGRWIANR